MKRYRAVLFDVDGTMLDTSQALHDSMLYTIEKLGLPPLTEAQIRHIYSSVAHYAIAEAYGISEEEGREIAKVYRQDFIPRQLAYAKVYDGIPELLARLKREGFLVATATLKQVELCQPLLDKLGLLPYFDVVSAQNKEYSLNKCTVIHNAVERLGLAGVEEAVLVGDSVFDAVGAGEAGIELLGVTYGFGFTKPEDLAAYPYAVGAAATPEEVGRLLCAGK